MDDIKLNPGGVLGALVLGGLAMVFFFTDDGISDRARSKLIIFSIIGGAFAGNFLWGVLFGKRKDQE